MRSYEDSIKIEKAIKYLVNQIEKSGDDPKPVILHSVRVALNLEHYGYSTEMVIAALLHDLLEDSETTLKDIESQFGKDVAELIKANSYNRSIEDKKQRFIDTFNRCLRAGKDALLIKVADILDNSDYYYLADDRAAYLGLVEKVKYFLDLSRKLLENEVIYKELSEKYKILKSRDFKGH